MNRKMEAENPARSTGLKYASINPNKPQPSPIPKPNQFPSHLDAPNVSSSARALCDILTRASPHDIETALSSSGIDPEEDLVKEVLKLSYNYPSSAVKFFRWAGRGKKHPAHTWNLMVDLLGKNQLFEPMWDAVRSMKQEEKLSLSTFASVFHSYSAAGRFNEAVMSFDVMDRYGVKQDVVAVNSLLSAICCEDNQTSVGVEFLESIKAKVSPDGDTFAILLEGWQKEGNAAKAKITFGDMVAQIGWNKDNVAAYDAFLMTLFSADLMDDVVRFLQAMKDHGCFPGLKFFTNALDALVKRNDAHHAIPMWDVMVSGELVPNLIMYNAMIGLLCNNVAIDHAIRLLDEMAFHGAFPDSLTYNMIFECLVKNKKARETGRFFAEMIKNEWPPTGPNCAAAIAMLFECDDPEAAHEIWSYVVENRVKPLDESANAMLVGLCNLSRFSEVKRLAEDVLYRRIKVYESTMTFLKDAFYKEGGQFSWAFMKVAHACLEQTCRLSFLTWTFIISALMQGTRRILY
ncbi:pentatricopeptide repeat-containing protein At1g77360, mitochondrial-like isoform X1 [Vigna umbellata]|uniref:pentatricopeptide repeat-containing protein At1g77360, mitochondrial-like isoform X1 n=1 Tax=Vigna umbellata TaxID=87088 RepID=UPI001F5FCC13|nr:pentatricopeptide repeat-containing protein At1g77360, mitochondrial-like isoform X1 [Vigna umbellata]